MNDKEYKIRTATLNDVYILVEHHSLMFEEIFSLDGTAIDFYKSQQMKKSYLQKLKTELPTCSYNAWLIEIGNKIIGSGSISICSMVPTLIDPSYLRAYLHSVYIDKKFRRRGFAKIIIEEIIEYCKYKNINHIFLHASKSGKPVYKSIGFISRETMEINEA
jgi:ribosomal protein S18 acetylase RimI-like enzyme